MAEEIKLLECEEEEKGESFYCRDLKENKGYKLIDEDLYDTLLAMFTSIPDVGGLRDIHYLAEIYKEHDDEYPNGNPYDFASECMESMGELNGETISYCLFDGLVQDSKDILESDIEDMKSDIEEDLGIEIDDFEWDEFVEWFKENVQETEFYYNYLDWGCSYEPEEGFCEVVEDVIRGNKYESDVEKLFEKWKEENMDEESITYE